MDLLLIRIEPVMTLVGLFGAPRELLVAGLNQALEYMVYIISLYVHWNFFVYSFFSLIELILREHS